MHRHFTLLVPCHHIEHQDFNSQTASDTHIIDDGRTDGRTSAAMRDQKQRKITMNEKDFTKIEKII